MSDIHSIAELRMQGTRISDESPNPAARANEYTRQMAARKARGSGY